MMQATVVPLIVTLADVPDSVVGSGKLLAYWICAGPMPEPKTTNREPCAILPF